MTTTSDGGCLIPLSLNKRPSPVSSSRLRANWKGLIISPVIPVSKPSTSALDFKTKGGYLQGDLVQLVAQQFCLQEL